MASRTYPGIYWMISDSGNPAHLYAIDKSGATKGVFKVSGATNRDWEDIAIDGSGHIWIGDIGDNSKVYSSYIVYKVNEPNPYDSATSTSAATAYRFVYPDGAHDAEALFVWQGTPYIVQKNWASEVYAFPTLDSSRIVALKYVGKFAGGNAITGADISTDGHRLALINDNYNYHWIIERSATSTNVTDFFTSPTKQWRIYYSNQQGEAIGFSEGSGFVVASEQGGFWKVDRDMYDETSDSPKTPASISGKYTLAWGTYDYGNARDVTVLPQEEIPSNSNIRVRAHLDISPYVVNGQNTVTFRQNCIIHSNSAAHYQWDSPRIISLTNLG
ncbi:MAG: hypothetical protein M1503_04310 [Thaumarchaeota archaeon]|nr:hypothetical protein [Nitrososphaerota archaeon]